MGYKPHEFVGLSKECIDPRKEEAFVIACIGNKIDDTKRRQKEVQTKPRIRKRGR